ncbi:MFS transporter [Saccharibacillus sp. CPCC 101409]|uniref:MFS transporter n=1 Tax=Saccharibacillus sp. CPCC 101409 TaxID=3058041 RepID=UPI0026724843|nr:MFS transporter [Saccharibacillus sp. CPCC 101409]MDO3412411.1 MFS transporter [Saccharibacillus sp. CPCC 101409]
MNKRTWWLMISIGLGVMLNPLNSSMVSVAIPALQEAFRLDFTTVSWIVFSFYISSAVAQPVMGKAGDLFGRKKIFLGGLLVAFLASLAAPWSPSFGWLIALRVLQSIGTSMMMAVGMALVRIHVTEKRASALAVLSVFLSGAAAVGPFIGGLLTSGWGWRAIFFVNLPFALAAFVLARRTIPDDPGREAGESGRFSLRAWLSRIDAPGAGLFAAGLILLFTGLLATGPRGQIGGSSLAGIEIATAGLLMLILFAVYELKVAAPFIPLRLFAGNPGLIRINIEFMLANLLFYAVFFGLPSYLQQVRGLSEFHTGLLMLSLGLCSLVVSPLAGRWTERLGPASVLRMSAPVITLGAAGMALLNPHTPLLVIVLILAAFGIANGLNGVAMQSALFAASPAEAAGVVSGMFITFRYLGTILSSLLTGLAMGGNFNEAGFRALGIWLIAAALILVVLSLGKRRSAEEETNR